MANQYTVHLLNGKSYNVDSHHQPNDIQTLLHDLAEKIRRIANDNDLRTIATAGSIMASIVSISANGRSIFKKR